MLNFRKGNMFESANSVDAIINTVNCVGVMGKGVALEFKKRYPENFKIYKQVCNEKKLSPGKMLTIHNSNEKQPNYIINFPTKKHWKNPSKIEYIEEGLISLKEEIKKYSIKSIALPALGCGNGGLNWNTVKKLLIKELSSLDDINFYIYEPSNKLKDKKGKSAIRITQQRVLLMSLINYYNTAKENEFAATFVEVNYLAYIVQFMGADLNLEFVSENKGPISSSINKLLWLLSEHNYLVIENSENNQNLIHLNKEKYKEKEGLLTKSKFLKPFEEQKKFIEGFESKNRIKALTITLWCYSKCDKEKDLFDEIMNWSYKYNHDLSTIIVREAISRVISYHESNVENLEFDI